MDTSAALTARDIVNGYDEKELKRILYKYGEGDMPRLLSQP